MPQIWISDQGQICLKKLKELLQTNGVTDASYGMSAEFAIMLCKSVEHKIIKKTIKKCFEK